MALQSSGAISIGNIRGELGTSDGSLRNLSSAAGKGTPDSMSEFYGYSNAPAYVTMSMPYGGGTYDGCYMSMDSYAYFEGTGYAGQYVGPWGDYRDYNTDGFGGTFLTYGGSTAASIRANTTISIINSSNGYGNCPCQTMYNIININGSRVSTVYAGCGTDSSYSFTALSGVTYNIEIGVWFG
jgi:hypothetical protein